MRIRILVAGVACVASAGAALAQQSIDPAHNFAWSENCGWLNWNDGGQVFVVVRPAYLAGHIWGENLGWIDVGVVPSGPQHGNNDDTDFGVNVDASGELSGYAWGENCGWINFSGGALADPPNPARLDGAAHRFRGFAWGENIGWINLDDDLDYVGVVPSCGSADFNCDGDLGTDRDIETFFQCLSGVCPPPPCHSSADFNGDGSVGTDADIEAFFRVLSGGTC